MERELKIKFEWREADKNLEKEERNKPVDLKTSGLNDLMALESRSWRSESAPQATGTPPQNRGSNGFRGRRNGSGNGGGNFSGNRSSFGRSNGSRGSSGSRPTRGNRGR